MIRLSPTSTAGRRAPGRHLFRSSLSTSASDDQSTIVGGPSLLTQTGVHRPSPSLFYLPGLRTLPFWTAPDDSSKLRIAFNDTSIKHAVEHVESNYKSIRQEYFGAVLGQGTSTDPLSGEIAKPLEPDYDLANKGGEHADGALHTGQWEWHSYILNGDKNNEFQDRCPVTAAVVDDLEKEGLLFKSPFSFSFFSTLHGNSSIQPHTGPMNLRLRVHLPLIVPKSTSAEDSNRNRPLAGIRVADQTREFREGSALVLDDSYVHEVWNEGDSPRVLFLFDLWHPDVHLEERERINNMFSYAKDQGWIGNQRKKDPESPATINVI